MENINYIAAIDLGSSDVVVAVGRRTSGGKVAVEEVVVRGSQGVVRGEVKNVELAAQSLKEAVGEMEEKLGVRISEAYTGISGSHIKCAKHPYYVYVESRDGEISDADVQRLNESMRNVKAPEGYRLMHIIPQHYVVNEDEEVANPVGMFGKTLGSTFNLIIGENAILSRLDKALQKVGIKKAGLFINPLAMAEAVTFPDEKELGVAVVDIGAGTTDLCIYQDGIVRYVGVIPLGADAINRDIRSYGIMERYVEELKTKYGCAVASMVDGEKLVKVPGRTPSDHKEISFHALAQIIEARLQDIIDYIVEEIKSAGYENRLSAGIILTGGSAQLKEIKTLMEKRTGLDVRVAVPDVLVDDSSREKAADTRLAAVIGILHQGAEEGVTTGVKLEKRTPFTPPAEVPPQGQDIFNPPIRTGQNTASGQGTTQVTTVHAGDHTHTDVNETREKKGFIQKLKERFEKTFDFDVLDDENTI